MKSKISIALLSLALAAPLALFARADGVGGSSAPAQPMAPTSAQTTASRLVYGLLSDSRYAYRPRALDETLSQDIFRRYIDSLDGSKLYFTAADIDAFAPYGQHAGESIRNGELAPAYDVFAVYKKRVAERVGFARQLLKQPFDFSTDERWEYDREHAAWAVDGAELDALWTKSIKNDWLRLKLAGQDADQIRKTLDKRYARLEKSVEELDGEDVFQFFLNSYTSAIDPHTDYYTPQGTENFNQSISLSLEGIGAVLQRQDEMIAIREVIPGGPAALSGKLQPGDRIVAVGQADDAMVDVVGWRVDDVVKLIRGKKDSKVRIEYIPVANGLEGTHATVSLIRQKVKLEEQAAKSEIIETPAQGSAPARRIGVIKLPTFYQDFEGRRRNPNDYNSATRDVARLLAQFKSEGIDGVVLDLRSNGGGSLDEAVELTGLFIDRGPVVQVRESGGRVSVNADTKSGVAWDGALAVLINRGSASASEIFAGAIQDYGRGLIIGETSFGKGTVQNMIDLDRWPANEEPRFGSVKLTIAQFFRVSGSSTQHKGVVPDLAFPVSVDASEYGESTYDNALPWTQIAAVDHVQYGRFAPLLTPLEQRHAARTATDKEWQWWAEDVAQFRAEREKKYVSLNEAERSAERDRNEAKRKQRQEERQALGLALDPLADVSDDGLGAAERDIVKDAEREKLAEKRPDPLLRESAAILADAIEVLGVDKSLSAKVLPASHVAGAWVD